MPKKVYEPTRLFDELLAETHAAEEAADPTTPKLAVRTDDPTYKSFADELIAQHYPPQSELPLIDA